MLNSTISTKISTVFLAAVLIAGTIALSYPSSLVVAQAERENGMEPRYNSYEPDHGSDYGMDSYDDKKSYEKDNLKSTEYPSYEKDSNSYDKSKETSSVSVKKIKCNNINVNVNGFNGLEIGTVPPALNGLTTEALASDEGKVGANSLESGSGSDGRSSGHDGGDSRFICINNNNFNVGDGGTPVPPVPPVEACLLCFEETTQALRDAINTFLDEQEVIEVAPGIQIPADVDNFEQLCAWLAEEETLLLTQTQITQLIAAFAEATGQPIDDVEELVDCFIKAGLIEVLPPNGGADELFCHVDANGGQHQLNIPPNAVESHLEHHEADFEGPCDA